MKVTIIAFGKLKTPGLREAADYYKKLSKTWTTVEEIELKPLPVPDKSPVTRIQIQNKEGTLLLERLRKEQTGRSLFFLLDEAGQARTTAQWAKEIRQWEQDSVPQISFCIGSSLGFSSEVRKLAHGKFSLGPQTLPHELARTVLFEQIYRSYSLLRGHPYHNEGS